MKHPLTLLALVTLCAGCEAPRAVLRCPRMSVAPMSVPELMDQRFRLSGQSVTVSGRLSASAACTELMCHDGTCCNHCGGTIVFAGTSLSSPHLLALGANDHDEAVVCRGDDSGLCCGTAVPTGEVIVRGVLRPVAGSGGSWRIETPTLCTMAWRVTAPRGGSRCRRRACGRRRERSSRR